jgi:branched-chain amino acid transport system permease protein
MLVGIVDTLGRVFLPSFFRLFMDTADAMSFGSALASMLIYLLMAIILAIKPKGLFPANA